MQDRFKFRYVLDNKICEVLAFDISDGIEHKCLFLQLKDGTRKIINDYDWSKFLQCTGLKDKNGKLIYEGDIVRDKCSEAVATIEYLSYTFSLMAHIRGMDDYLPLEDICYALEVATPFEVIGNIYENPELLEVSNDH